MSTDGLEEACKAPSAEIIRKIYLYSMYKFSREVIHNFHHAFKNFTTQRKVKILFKN